jgi:hypothetical protein
LIRFLAIQRPGEQQWIVPQVPARNSVGWQRSRRRTVGKLVGWLEWSVARLLDHLLRARGHQHAAGE